MSAILHRVNHISRLSAHWERHWPGSPTEADLLKARYTDRWVRFHSLPESKRYADTEAVYDRLRAAHHPGWLSPCDHGPYALVS
jgi:hypothetical protein